MNTLNKKRIVVPLIIVFMMIGLSGCNEPSSQNNDTEDNSEPEVKEKIISSLNNISVEVDEFEGNWELIGDIYVDEEYYNNDQTSFGYGWYFSERSEYRLESETQIAKYQLNLRISRIRDKEDYEELIYYDFKQKAEASLDNLIEKSNLISLQNFERSVDISHEQIGDMSYLVSAGGQRTVNGTPHYINMHILFYKIANVIIEINCNSLTIQRTNIEYGKEIVMNAGSVIEDKVNDLLVTIEN